MTTEVSAIILAGGRSTRLGRDKASEPLLGTSLLQRVVTSLESVVDEIVIVRAGGQDLPEVATSASLKVVKDIHADLGPLAAIYTGLKTISTASALTVACDLPLLQPNLLAGLLMLQSDDYDAVVPTNDMFLPEPLCAVYSTRCLLAIESQLDADALKVALFLDKVRVRFVPPTEWRAWDPEGRSFLNVNHHHDLARAEELLRASGDAH